MLPDALVEDWPPRLSAADEKGWFRFQRLYDVARSVLRTEDDVRRLVLEAAEDDVRDGGRWLEIQVDPSGYAARFGGITAFTDLVLDACATPRSAPGSGIAVVIAANRTRHPLDARTLARLAAQYAGRGVVGFGLSNDERRGTTADFAPAFAIADRAGLLLVPHGGELLRAGAACAPASTRCTPTGSGTASARSRTRRCSSGSSTAGVALEVCPVSNVALGVYSDLTSVPLPQLLEAGATVALGADDPLLFGSRLAGAVRHHARRPRPHRRPARPSWPGCRSAPRARRPTWSKTHARPTSTPGWRGCNTTDSSADPCDLSHPHGTAARIGVGTGVRRSAATARSRRATGSLTRMMPKFVA